MSILSGPGAVLPFCAESRKIEDRTQTGPWTSAAYESGSKRITDLLTPRANRRQEDVKTPSSRLRSTGLGGF